MKTETLMYAISDIRDSYVADYAKLSKKSKEKRSSWKQWHTLAASIVVMICLGSILFVYYGITQTDDPRNGEYYSFHNYSELCALLPSEHVFHNLDLNKISITKCEGYYDPDSIATPGLPAGYTDDYLSFYRVIINAKTIDSVEIRLLCEISPNTTLQEYIQSNQPFGSNTGNEEVVSVNGHEIHYSLCDHPDGNIVGYAAVFADHGDIFKIVTTLYNENSFLEYVANMLNG